MNLQHRIDLLLRLGEYMLSDDSSWLEAKEKAGRQNGWFTPEFVELSCNNIAGTFLQKEILENWVKQYEIAPSLSQAKTAGVVMAGNIPLVGFHDLLCVFISGHKALIKPSSKDDVLIKHLVAKLAEWDAEVNELIQFAEMLKGCDAYIATGSNNSAGYFEYYFKKYPHIIRRNRTSVAIISGTESKDELEKLADDVFLYFGLGCRNVTKLYAPAGYDFVPLLNAFSKYDHLAEHHKYKNNYDYNLALHLLNKKFYMSTPALLLVEESSVFSPISQLNYEFYDSAEKLPGSLTGNTEIQAIVGKSFTPFGQAQCPSITDYADAVDTLLFLKNL
ncbi:MAG TPA: acyl-CoA reductase [Chitinophagaceae bacterium]